MLGKEELLLLANTSKRNQQLEKDFEQIATAAIDSMRMIEDLKILLISLANELRKANPDTDLPDKVLLYMVKNQILDNSTRLAILSQ